MKLIKIHFITFFLSAFLIVNAQEKKKFRIHTVAFYNLENLFDTINDITKFDEASPLMEMKTGREEAYKMKACASQGR